jgi:hypothetical protein
MPACVIAKQDKANTSFFMRFKFCSANVYRVFFEDGFGVLKKLKSILLR